MEILMLLLYLLLIVAAWLVMSILLESLYLTLYGGRSRANMAAVRAANLRSILPQTFFFFSGAMLMIMGNMLVFVYLAVAEYLVIIIETNSYRSTLKDIEHPMRFAVLSNAFSGCVGMIVNTWIIWQMHISI